MSPVRDTGIAVGGLRNIRLMTTAEAANVLRCSRRTVRRLVERGDLRALKVGRVLRIDERDLGQLISKNSTAAKTGTDAGEAADLQAEEASR